MSIEQRKNGQFRYNFMINGYREHRVIVNCDSLKKAKEYEKDRKTLVSLMLKGKIEADENIKLFLNKKAIEEKKIYTVDFLCESLINDYIEKGNKTVEKVKTHTDFFKEFFGAETDIKTIDEDNIIEMIKELKTHKNKRNEPLSNATINRYMSSLKRAYNILNINRRIKLNYYPFCDKELKKKPEKQKSIVTIPPEKEQEFFNAFPTPQNDIVELYFNLGLRISNILFLNKEQIDIKNMRIKISPKDNKGKKEINLKINKRAEEIILKYYDNAKYYLFTHQKPSKCAGQPIKSIKKSWKTAAKAIGIDPKTTSPHDGRRTFGTKVYRKTKDILAAQKLLYHSNPEVTLKYLRIEQAELDYIMETLNN